MRSDQRQLLDTVDEALKRVLAGGFSFISFSNYVKVAVASNYADALGNSPFHLSREEVPVMAVFGWPVRSGAPFQYRFRDVMNRLEDAGITPHWKDEVIALRVKQNRADASKGQDGNSPYEAASFKQLEASQDLVLGIMHLQGAFYVLLFGSGIAFLTLLGERHYRTR
ncbi:uncharacterized protein LOC135109461 [Scylla paramamosain]|uniref:uncharacterized protein LOC135109461 n=1 Tax=Scylla paramamosain TaxID=85552 RepID=UPI003082AF24